MMRWLRVCALAAAVFAATPSVVSAIQPQPPKGFVPAEEVPESEQIPAINLVAAAYGFVWVALLGYVWSLGRRLQRVESELSELETRRK
jgi:CcmD family protein